MAARAGYPPLTGFLLYSMRGRKSIEKPGNAIFVEKALPGLSPVIKIQSMDTSVWYH